MLFRPGNPDDRIHHHALDRDRQPNLGRDKSQIGVFGTDYTTPKTGCPTAGVIDTIFFRKYEGENETYIEASAENSGSTLYDKEIRDKPRTRHTKRNV